MRVGQIWRFPVKSLGGERLDRAAVDGRGIEGDRAWGVHDPATGLVLTARREPALLFLTARWVDGRPVITAEDGAVLADDAALSEWLGRPVELLAAGKGPGTFETPIDADRETDWVRWQSTDGTFHDGRSKISLVSTTTLGEWDRRRFRINLVLERDDGTPEDRGTDEDALRGELRVGTARLRIRGPIDRCVMVTRAQPGIPKDVSVLRRIVRERDNRLGIGAVVVEPGVVAVGDELVSSR